MTNGYTDESIMKLSGEPLEYRILAACKPEDYIPETALHRFIPDPALVVEEISYDEWRIALDTHHGR